MKKKLLMLLCIVAFVIIGMSVPVFSACGYTYQEGDFVLTVAADRTEVRVGETIEFTIILENVSGRDIPIQHFFHGQFNLETIFVVGLCYDLYPDGFSYAFTSEISCVNIIRRLRRRRRLTIKNGEVVTLIKEHIFEECSSICYFCEVNNFYFKTFAGAMFYVNNDFIRVTSDPVKIYIIRGDY